MMWLLSQKLWKVWDFYFFCKLTSYLTPAPTPHIFLFGSGERSRFPQETQLLFLGTFLLKNSLRPLFSLFDPAQVPATCDEGAGFFSQTLQSENVLFFWTPWGVDKIRMGPDFCGRSVAFSGKQGRLEPSGWVYFAALASWACTLVWIWMAKAAARVTSSVDFKAPN